MIRWTSVFGSPTPPPRLTALGNAGRYPEQPSHEPHCSQFLHLKDGLGAVRHRSPVLERLVPPEDLG